MDMLMTATSLDELKLVYKRLATLCHPDKGGNHVQMQKLNSTYQLCIKKLKQMTSGCDDFSSITIGQQIFVNGTPCEVLEIKSNCFRVVAIGRSRQAVFDLKTGIGLYNKRLRASFDQQKYARAQ